MFHLFKQDKESGSQDVKQVRSKLLQFIKEQLGKAEGGEGANIKGIQLFIACGDDEKQVYESAVYFDEEDRFKKEEVQRIADDFAIDLPDSWTMETTFVNTLPADALKVPDLAAALFIQTRKRSIKKTAVAYIKVLVGEAEKESYTITSESKKIYIGREKKVQAANGFYRVNTIAFSADSENESNKFISRQHAHIEWNNEEGNFLLFADEGGIPPRNKIKVRSADGSLEKLQTTQIGHPLQDGDQVILGETALLEFSYTSEG